MVIEKLIKKKLKKLEEISPEAAREIEKELLPLSGEEVGIKVRKKKKEL